MPVPQWPVPRESLPWRGDTLHAIQIGAEGRRGAETPPYTGPPGETFSCSSPQRGGGRRVGGAPQLNHYFGVIRSIPSK